MEIVILGATLFALFLVYIVYPLPPEDSKD